MTPIEECYVRSTLDRMVQLIIVDSEVFSVWSATLSPGYPFGEEKIMRVAEVRHHDWYHFCQCVNKDLENAKEYYDHPVLTVGYLSSRWVEEEHPFNRKMLVVEYAKDITDGWLKPTNV